MAIENNLSYSDQEIQLIREMATDHFDIKDIATALNRDEMVLLDEYLSHGPVYHLIRAERLKCEKEIRDRIFQMAKAGDAEMIKLATKYISRTWIDE